MYCSCSNYLGPNEFGYHVVLKFVLGTLEMHWKLVSSTRKVVSPCDMDMPFGYPRISIPGPAH
jgi:hypothetical protein